MDDSVVGACPPGYNTGGKGDSPVIPPNESRASEPGVLGGDLIFDAAALHTQLADLLQIYLKRAGDPGAVKKCSAKDAISCAKTLTTMISDVQLGKPASVDKDTEWSRLESSSVGRPFTGHRPDTGTNQRRGINPRPAGYPLTPSPQSPVSSLEEAVAVICNSDEETAILEPWARLVARIQKLCIEPQKRLDAAESDAPASLIDDSKLKTDDCFT